MVASAAGFDRQLAKAPGIAVAHRSPGREDPYCPQSTQGLARRAQFSSLSEVPQSQRRQVLEHIKEGKCERRLAVFHQLDKESLLIGYLSRGRN